MPDYRAMARRAARRHGIDPVLFERQINAESGFAEDVITGRRASGAGAKGIAQIMPDTARGWGVDPLDPKAALNAAAKHMAGYIKTYGGWENALRAYNAGPGAVEKSKGFDDTNAYVQRIMAGHTPSDRGGGGSGGGGDGGGGGGGSRVQTGTKTIPGATLYGIGGDADAPSELDVVMKMLAGKSDPLEMAQELQGLEDSAAQTITLPGTKVQTAKVVGGPAKDDEGGGGKLSPSMRGESLSELGSDVSAAMRRLGLTAGSGPRSASHNAAVGGADDSDHLADGYGKTRWARDYPTAGDKGRAVYERIAKRFGLEPGDGFAEGSIRVGKRRVRVQVIFGAKYDHGDHVHVGFRAA